MTFFFFLREGQWDLLHALAYLHNTKIRQRDVKPENILLPLDHQRVVLADFGLASVDAQTCSSFGAGSKPFQSPGQFLPVLVSDEYAADS